MPAFPEAVKVVQFANVSLNTGNVAADGLDGLVQFLLATASDEDISALFDEKLCRSKPYARSAAGDDRYLSLQLPILATLSRSLSALISHQAFIPPSTVRFVPVMYEDSGPATNATIAAISSTDP
jgi:hypothetical protein